MLCSGDSAGDPLGGYLGISRGLLCLSGLALGQSVQGAEESVSFLHVFGGSVGVHTAGSGTTFPKLQWQVSGSKGRRAAGMLSAACLGKQRELRQHAAGRKMGGQAGQEIMRLWKQTPPPAVQFGSWSEVAGFFYAEGCFDTRLKSIEIRVSQKHAAPLEALRVFILQQLGIQANIYEYGSGHVLIVGASESVKMICRELLQAGLRQKGPG